MDGKNVINCWGVIVGGAALSILRFPSESAVYNVGDRQRKSRLEGVVELKVRSDLEFIL